MRSPYESTRSRNHEGKDCYKVRSHLMSSVGSRTLVKLCLIEPVLSQANDINKS